MNSQQHQHQRQQRLKDPQPGISSTTNKRSNGSVRNNMSTTATATATASNDISDVAIDLNNYALSELLCEGNYITAYQVLSYAIEMISSQAKEQQQQQHQHRRNYYYYTWIDCTQSLQRSTSHNEKLNQQPYIPFLCMKFLWIGQKQQHPQEEKEEEENESSSGCYNCCPSFAWVLWYK